MRKWFLIISMVFLQNMVVVSAETGYSYRGNISLQSQYFTASDIQNLAAENAQSVSLTAEFIQKINDSNARLVLAPFLRFDSLDNKRSHWDFRELKYSTYGDTWDFEIGVGKVFWGVAETRNVVNIINQLDALEGPTSQDTLGQPMIHYTHIRDWGNLEFFLLPYFRQRNFAGNEARPRAEIEITNDVSYESSTENQHIDVAARYSHTIGDWDLGFSLFSGTGREPLLIADDAMTSVKPFYYQLQHTGLDLQATIDSWLLKTELAYQRSDYIKDHLKLVSGFEYTLFDIKESGIDLGLVSEYLYDGSEASNFAIFQNDVLLGMRVAFNDEQSTEALFAYSYDIDDSSEFFTIEFNRRVASSYKLNIEATTLRNESYFSATLGWYF